MNPKSYFSSLLALSSVLSGPYKDIDISLSKPVRDVPEYARKKEQSRNEKCACGSGLKYKKCCGK